MIRTAALTATFTAAFAFALTACSGGGSGGTSSRPATSSHRAAASTSASRPSQPAQSSVSAGSATKPRARWDHVVVVLMENHSYADVIGNPAAPYLNRLAARGASFSHAYAETHPSEPNYLALFSGSTHGLRSDQCPLHFSGANVFSELQAAGRSVVGYSEGLPSTGYTGCTSGAYARRHAPWINFSNLSRRINQPMTRFPSKPAALPALSFVVPNLNHDMHDGSIAAGDRWVSTHLARYAGWAAAHRSLLLITWDEDDRSANNRIPTLAVGAGVRRGVATERISHYGLLRAIEDGFAVHRLGLSAQARAIPQLSG